MEYNILSEHEYGFRSNSSTEIATYKLRNEISEPVNKRKITDGIYCDLRKTFGYVDHRIILTKLELCGIKGSLFKFIK
jgi:hypothetical protein